MMRFRCPHCQQILELVTPTEMLLCPACELWCRIPLPASTPRCSEPKRSETPAPQRPKNEGLPASARWSQGWEPREDELQLRIEPTQPTLEPRIELPQEPSLTPVPPEPAPPLPQSIPVTPVEPPPHAVTNDLPHDLPLAVRAETSETEPIEAVELQVVERGGKRRRKRRRSVWRRYRGEFDYWISPQLILLLLFAPGSLLLVVIAFLFHPGAGIGSLFLVVGGLWLMLIAAEDGLMTAILVMFVPFYVFYYVFLNFERTAIPFLLQCIGIVIFAVGLAMAAMRAVERQVSLPPAILRCEGLAPRA
jgi:hypothetical protein